MGKKPVGVYYSPEEDTFIKDSQALQATDMKKAGSTQFDGSEGQAVWARANRLGATNKNQGINEVPRSATTVTTDDLTGETHINSAQPLGGFRDEETVRNNPFSFTEDELKLELDNGYISPDTYQWALNKITTETPPPEVQQQIEDGERKADETIAENETTDVDNDDTDPGDTDPGDIKPEDPPEVQQNKHQYQKSMQSIWDAYRNKEIDEGTAMYFTIDALSKLAGNMGRIVNNVAAANVGGTIDNGHDTSLWEQRRNRMLQEEMEKEAEGMGGPSSRKAESETLDNQAKAIRNKYTPQQLEKQLEMMGQQISMNEYNLKNMEDRRALIDQFHKMAEEGTIGPDVEAYAVSLLADVGTGGATQMVLNTVSDLMDAISSHLGIHIGG